MIDVNDIIGDFQIPKIRKKSGGARKTARKTVKRATKRS